MTFFAILIIIAAIVLFIVIKPNKSHHTSYNFDEEREQEDNNAKTYRKPKISAEVSDTFNSQVQSYCRNHSLTVAEFIRRATKDYMDKNP